MPNCTTASAARSTKLSRALAMSGCSSRSTSSSRAISKSRCSATRTATSCISASANARSSDPTRNFLPSIGHLVRYCPPEGDGIRIDSGVFEGAEISLYYDPMIAKLIAYGADREAAIGQLQDALDGFYISGVRHNVAFLAAIAASELFHAGALSTDFIAESFPDGFIPPVEPVAADRAILVAAVLAELRLRDAEGSADGTDTPPELVVLLDGRSCRVSVRSEGP